MKANLRPSPGKLLRAGFTILIAAISANADQVEEVAGISKVSPTQVDPATLDQDVMKERHLIVAEVLKLLKEGATSEQVEEWHERNSARLAANQQKLAAMAARQISVARPYIAEVRISPGASGPMQELLMGRAELHNDRARIENQMLQASPRLREEALAAWELQNTAAIAAQGELAKQVSNESQVPTIQPPPTPRVPANASPELRSLLAARHAFMTAQAEITDRLRNASPEEREQAIEDWHTQNSAGLQALQEAAVQVSNRPNTTR